jgi:hypothetical protein
VLPPDIHENSIEPLKLNFSNEAIVEEEMPYLGEFPSLKDLETSNLYSYRFHTELAHKLALMSLGGVNTLRHEQM